METANDSPSRSGPGVAGGEQFDESCSGGMAFTLRFVLRQRCSTDPKPLTPFHMVVVTGATSESMP
jgi:hypothetical protein